jgi:hypothetical protein
MTQGALILALAAISQAAGTSPRATTFTSKEAGFSIEFPAKPTETIRKVDTPDGPLVNKIFQANGGENVYSIICAVIPGTFKPSHRAMLLESICDGYLTSTGGTLVEHRELKVDSEPAREVTIQLPNGRMYCRYFIKGRRIYQIMMTSLGEDDPAGFKRFASTFKALKPVGNLSDGPGVAKSWRDYRSKAGGYSVKMLGDPIEQVQKVKTPAGVFEVHVAMSNSPTGDNFGVSYRQVERTEPPVAPATLYDNAIQGATENARGKLSRRKPIELDGNPGVEVEIDLSAGQPYPDGVLLARYFWIKDRLYQVKFVGERARLKDNDVRAFLDSFHPDDSKGKPAKVSRDSGERPR